MPSVYRQKNNIVPAIRGCAKSAAPDVLYAARIDVYHKYMNGQEKWSNCRLLDVMGIKYVSKAIIWNESIDKWKRA